MSAKQTWIHIYKHSSTLFQSRTHALSTPFISNGLCKAKQIHKKHITNIDIIAFGCRPEVKTDVSIKTLYQIVVQCNGYL